ncbi:GntR family transcriptional regulator [Arthrobacter sp. EPSL27]|uniref:GntR family transcriptional regulator n=1 Tax=Arthrobacter sp. EPSL27 TaxID=1745378 RepID=UPI000749C2B4|nr:GntR family transcriptional regulator [Arthrobacter sp. EPSL27]KUM36729.1 GntR family transcriptional regulator [Arthrobacter sp. EPSL27]
MPVPSLAGVHKRPLLRDNVFESIRNAIVDGTFEPGERLKDSELEAWLGVSRTPIREALLRLERAGLVIALPGKSTIVAPFDLASTLSTQQVVAGLHELAARLAVPVLAEPHVAAMEEANARFGRALQESDVDAALAADDEFHAVLVAASGNPVLQELLEQTTPVLRRVERMRFASFAARESVAQHAEIIRLARLGDAEGAARACRDNWLSLRFASAE